MVKFEEKNLIVMEFDEQAAIDYIRAHMTEEDLSGVNDDEILNLIDVVYDYYEDHGFLEMSLDEDEDDEVDINDMVKYVQKVIAKDKKSPLTPDAVDKMVRLEVEYEESIEDEF